MAFKRQTIPFHLLKVRDKFRIKIGKEIYTKTGEGTGRAKNAKSEVFWPTQSVFLVDPMDLDEFRAKYPEAEYRY